MVGWLASFNRVGPERGPSGSLSVNPAVPEFEESYAWGARPHPFRTGGPQVDCGPPLLLPRMFPGVGELARLEAPVGFLHESGTGTAFGASPVHPAL